MERYLQWMVKKRPILNVYFNRKKPSCQPTKQYWFMVYVLLSFTKSVHCCLEAIQRLTTHLNEQQDKLNKLTMELCDKCVVEGPGTFTEHLQYLTYGNYRVSLANAEDFIKDQDMFVAHLLEELKVLAFNEYKTCLRDTAMIFACSIDGLTKLSVKWDKENNPTSTYPAVLPNEMVLM